MSKRQRDSDEEDNVVEEKPKAESTSSGKKKALPPGYVCKACGMVDDHAIYNCTKAIKKVKEPKVVAKPAVAEPAATAVKGESTETEAKTETKKAAAEPTVTTSPLTVFMSGLPFKIKRTTIIDLFQKKGFAEGLQGKDVKLVMFEDKPDKCRGLAYVTFKDDADFQKALKMNGTEMEGRTLQIVPCAPMTSGSAAKANKPFVKMAFKGGKGALPEGVVKIPRCYRCGLLHDVNQCTNKRICYKCKSTEHLSSQCPNKKPKVAQS